MMSATKIPAFTVMEFSVAMVLTSLVVGFGYQAISMFSGKSVTQHKTTDQNQELIALETTLRSDFQNASYIEAENNSILCNYPTRQVRYTWNDLAIIRQIETASDTFHIPVSKWNCAFDQRETAIGWIDEITLETHLKNVPYAIACHKTYDALHLMQYEKNFGN